MNKYVKTLALSLICSAQLFASHSDCFRQYKVTFANRSGGVADITRTKGVRGVSRKTELENNSSIQILIQKRGSEISVKAGPEGNKTSRDIKFYSKDFRSYRPSVVLNQKGVSAEGFSQKPITFSVKVENQSGGIARITDSCDASGRGTSIANGKSTSITVKPSGYIVVEAGAEKQKVQTKIVFAEQTGDQPQVTLVKRGFMSRGIQGRNLEIQAQRVSAIQKKHTKPLSKAKKVKVSKSENGKAAARTGAGFSAQQPEFKNRHIRRTN